MATHFPSRRALVLIFNLFLHHVITTSAAATSMWSTCATAVTTSFSIPTTGGDFEAIGCNFKSVYVSITDQATRISPASILVASGTVGATTSLRGIAIAWVDNVTAPTMPPIHIAIQNMTFLKESILRFTGALPPSSSVIIANNSFSTTVKNFNIPTAQTTVAVAIGICETGGYLDLQSNSQFIVSNNSFAGGQMATTGQISLSMVFMFARFVRIVDESAFIFSNNTWSDSIYYQSAYMFSWFPQRFYLSNRSAFVVSGNTVTNTTGGSMLWVMFLLFSSCDLTADGGSTVVVSANTILNTTLSSSYGNGYIGIIYIYQIGSVLLSNSSTLDISSNLIINSTLAKGGGFIGIYWSAIAASRMYLSNNSAVSADGNQVMNCSSFALIQIVYLTLTNGDIVLDGNSSLSFSLNSIQGCTSNTELTAVYLGISQSSSGYVFTVRDRSSISASGNLIGDSTSYTATYGPASPVTINAVYGLTLNVEQQSAVAFNNNKLLRTTVAGEARGVYIYSTLTNAAFQLNLINAMLTMDGNRLIGNVVAGNAQVVQWLVGLSTSTSATQIISLDNATLSASNNSASDLFITGYAHAVIWSVFGTLSANVMNNSRIRQNENTLKRLTSSSTTYAYTVLWSSARSSTISFTNSSWSMVRNSLDELTARSFALALYIYSKTTLSITADSGSAVIVGRNSISNTVATNTAAASWFSADTTLTLSLTTGSSILATANCATNVSSPAVWAVSLRGTSGVLNLLSQSRLVLSRNIISESNSQIAASIVNISASSTFALSLDNSSILFNNNSMVNSAISRGTVIALTQFTGLVTMQSEINVSNSNAQNVTVSRQLSVVGLITTGLFEGRYSTINFVYNSASGINGGAQSVSIVSITVAQLQLLGTVLNIQRNDLQLLSNNGFTACSILSLALATTSSAGFIAKSNSSVTLMDNSLTTADDTTSGDAALFNITSPMSLTSNSSFVCCQNTLKVLTATSSPLMSIQKPITIGADSSVAITSNTLTSLRVSEGCGSSALSILSALSDGSLLTTALSVENNSISIGAVLASRNLLCPWLVMASVSTLATVTIARNQVQSIQPMFFNSTSLSVPASGLLIVSDNTLTFSPTTSVVGYFWKTWLITLATNATIRIERNVFNAPFQPFLSFGIMSAAAFTSVATSAVQACGNTFFGIDVGKPAKAFTPSSLAAKATLCTASYTIPIDNVKFTDTQSLLHSQTPSGLLSESPSRSLTGSESLTVASLSATLSTSLSYSPNGFSETKPNSETIFGTTSLSMVPTNSLEPSHSNPILISESNVFPGSTTQPLESTATVEVAETNSLVMSLSTTGNVEPPATSSLTLVGAAPTITGSYIVSTATAGLAASLSIVAVRTSSLTTGNSKSTVLPKSHTVIDNRHSNTVVNQQATPSASLRLIRTNSPGLNTTETSSETETNSANNTSTSTTELPTADTTTTNFSTSNSNETSFVTNATDGNPTETTTASGENQTSASVETMTNETTKGMETTYTSPTASEATTSRLSTTAIDNLCPTNFSLLSPATELTIAEVRSTAIVVQIELAQPNYQWTLSEPFNASSVTIISSSKFRASASVCTANQTLLVCQIPSLSDYAMPDELSQDVVGVYVGPLAFASSCSYGADETVLVGTFTIAQRNPTEVAAGIASFITFAVAAGPVLLALVGDPTNVEMQALVAMFSAQGCSTVDEREAANVARYISLSPFIGMGAEEVVLGHIGIIAAVIALQLIAAMLVMIISRSDDKRGFVSDLKRVLFPQGSAVVAGVLFIGLCYSSFELIFADRRKEEDDGHVIGYVGIVLSVIIVGAHFVTIALRQSIDAEYLPYTLSAGCPDAKLGKFSKAVACYDTPAIRKWIWPRGTYAPVITRRAFSSTLYSVVPTRVALAPYPLVMSFVTSLLLHVGYDGTSGSESTFRCSHRWIAIAVWFALFSIVLAASMPHRAIANSHATSFCYGILVVVAALSAAENSPEIGLDSGSLFNAKAALAIVLMIVGIIRAVHTLLFTLWLERREEEQAIKKKTVYFGRDTINDYAVEEACKQTADMMDDGIFVNDPTPATELSDHVEDDTSDFPHRQKPPVQPIQSPSASDVLVRRAAEFSSSSASSSLNSDFDEINRNSETTEAAYDFTSDPDKTDDTTATLVVSERGIINLQRLPSMDSGDEMYSTNDSLDEMVEITSIQRRKKKTLDNVEDEHQRQEMIDEEDFLF